MFPYQVFLKYLFNILIYNLTILDLFYQIFSVCKMLIYYFFYCFTIKDAVISPIKDTIITEILDILITVFA